MRGIYLFLSVLLLMVYSFSVTFVVNKTTPCVLSSHALYYDSLELAVNNSFSNESTVIYLCNSENVSFLNISGKDIRVLGNGNNISFNDVKWMYVVDSNVSFENVRLLGYPHVSNESVFINNSNFSISGNLVLLNTTSLPISYYAVFDVVDSNASFYLNVSGDLPNPSVFLLSHNSTVDFYGFLPNVRLDFYNSSVYFDVEGGNLFFFDSNARGKGENTTLITCGLANNHSISLANSSVYIKGGGRFYLRDSNNVSVFSGYVGSSFPPDDCRGGGYVEWYFVNSSFTHSHNPSRYDQFFGIYKVVNSSFNERWRNDIFYPGHYFEDGTFSVFYENSNGTLFHDQFEGEIYVKGSNIVNSSFGNAGSEPIYIFNSVFDNSFLYGYHIYVDNASLFNFSFYLFSRGDSVLNNVLSKDSSFFGEGTMRVENSSFYGFQYGYGFVFGCAWGSYPCTFNFHNVTIYSNTPFFPVSESTFNFEDVKIFYDINGLWFLNNTYNNINGRFLDAASSIFPPASIRVSPYVIAVSDDRVKGEEVYLLFNTTNCGKYKLYYLNNTTLDKDRIISEGRSHVILDYFCNGSVIGILTRLN